MTLLERLSRSDAELGRLNAVHPVADRDDGVQVVELDLAGNVAVALSLNSSNFSKSCRFIQFSRIVDLLQVVTDRAQVEELLLAPQSDSRRLTH